jgi:hypothetical protein
MRGSARKNAAKIVIFHSSLVALLEEFGKFFQKLSLSCFLQTSSPPLVTTIHQTWIDLGSLVVFVLSFRLTWRNKHPALPVSIQTLSGCFAWQ